MGIYTLDEDEVFIMRASDVMVGTFGKADLVLTNKNIIQVNKGFFGGEKDAEKYPLAELKVYNDKANIVSTKNKAGKRQVEMYFSDFEKVYFFDSIFLQNKWVSEVKKVHKQHLEDAEKARKQAVGKASVFKTLTDSAKGIIPKHTPVSKTIKCEKCGAELSGLKGEVIRCEYCSFENTIK